jgi:dienelactone hydrolase
MRTWFLAALLAALAVPGRAQDIVDPFTAPLRPQTDLPQPAEATAFAYRSGANIMFKPEGAGPFPALVLMPTCSGHRFWNTFDWAKRALALGYVTLVVDPLAPRNVGSNCTAPITISASRLLKDAYDAAAHLRKQSIVDAERVGLIGFSQGAMVGLGAASAKHVRDYGDKPFRAVVGLYPNCIARGIRGPSGQLRDVYYLSPKIVVPILVEMGDLDNEGDPKDCIPGLEEAKKSGAPVEYVLYKDATHSWDATETRNQSFSKKGNQGQTIVYRYNSLVTEQSVKDAFAFFDARLKRSSAP